MSGDSKLVVPGLVREGLDALPPEVRARLSLHNVDVLTAPLRRMCRDQQDTIGRLEAERDESNELYEDACRRATAYMKQRDEARREGYRAWIAACGYLATRDLFWEEWDKESDENAELRATIGRLETENKKLRDFAAKAALDLTCGYWLLPGKTAPDPRSAAGAWFYDALTTIQPSAREAADGR